ncbi:ferrous iron transport protein B [Anaerolentibacter hominis]|uniref:ferrous iron transport protein B n=1 Tax=Anaerolentibacter hominis TaxID=3079009 RepID=UPI003CCEB4BF
MNAASIDIRSVQTEFTVRKTDDSDRVIALAGNPNVGKSTVFNELTGLKQHTGNWPGKTVTNAQGTCIYKDRKYIIVDLPGCYSLMAHSAEEEVARDFICFGEPDAIVVVCDATCLERNLNLVLQAMEITPNVILCINLMDEAKKKHIRIDLQKLSEKLRIPVVGTSARSRKGLDKLQQLIEEMTQAPDNDNWEGDGYRREALSISYPAYIEEAVQSLIPVLEPACANQLNTRWLALRLLDQDKDLMKTAGSFLGADLLTLPGVAPALADLTLKLTGEGISNQRLKDDLVSAIVHTASDLCLDTVHFDNEAYASRDRKIDRILTSKWTGFPIMFATLLLIFWLTITGANYPSQLLSNFLFGIQDKLIEFFISIGAPPLLYNMLVLGVYRVLAWVVSVMLPPMAIFFPLFTLLEDLGYLPRVAFNLDKCFKKCCACGKQALTMCMGFGCNAAGIVGCRIIDSPRERLIAMITNNFVPCNGRFPTLIAIISMFFLGTATGFGQSFLSAVFLAGFIVLGIVMTLLVSKVLSHTILKGVPSSFTLELPPYRKPQVGKVIVRSIFDRTLFVLGRAVAVAAPAGLLIWLMANVTIGDMTLLAHCAGFLDPFARLFGMDGVILLAFILGLPANEIVFPIIIMAYLAQGSLIELDNLNLLKDLLVQNGWTWITAISTMLFSLMHWPCSTTCITIKKETQSVKWTVISFLVPTVTGLILCFAFSHLAALLF